MTAAQKTTSNKRMTKGSLRPVTDAVRPLVRKILPQKSVVFQQLFDFWPEIVANTEAERSVPEKLMFARQQQNNGVLSIWAQSSAQATEISYNRTQLLHRINAVFGYSLVSEIKVTAFPGTGTIRPKTNPAKVNSNKGVPSQSLDKILDGISNPSLRETLAGLAGVLDAQPIDNPDSKGNSHA